MHRAAAATAVVVVLTAISASYALYLISDKGNWPEHWPAELEKLRAQSRTAVGPMVEQAHHDIPFTNRARLESAWRHILKVKSHGAPVILLRGPSQWLGQTMNAGVRIRVPPAGTDKKANPERPLPGQRSVRSRWMWTTYIEPIVDGEIVDLNRIPLPADTPIIDRRFEEEGGSAVHRTGSSGNEEAEPRPATSVPGPATERGP